MPMQTKQPAFLVRIGMSDRRYIFEFATVDAATRSSIIFKVFSMKFLLRC